MELDTCTLIEHLLVRVSIVIGMKIKYSLVKNTSDKYRYKIALYVPENDKLEKHELQLDVKVNPDYPRSGNVTLKAEGDYKIICNDLGVIHNGREIRCTYKKKKLKISDPNMYLNGENFVYLFQQYFRYGQISFVIPTVRKMTEKTEEKEDSDTNEPLNPAEIEKAIKRLFPTKDTNLEENAVNESNDEPKNNASDRHLAIKIGEELKKHVIGQNEYIERLALHVQEHILMGHTSPMMVIGKSGNGKTYTVEMLIEKCKHLLPAEYGFKYVDCSSLTEHGFTGGEVSDIFKRITFTSGIIFLDEIDKIIRVSSNGKGENVNLAVQTELMNYISGKKVTMMGKEIDTSKFLFILGGAFTDLYDLHNRKSRSIGFVSDGDESSLTPNDLKTSERDFIFVDEDDSSTDYPSNELDYILKNNSRVTVNLRNDLVKIGAARELMGRIGTIIILQNLSREDFKQILDTSILPAKIKTVKDCYGIDILLTDTVKDIIISAAEANEFGARIIRSMVDNLIDGMIYQAISEASKRTSLEDTLDIQLTVDFVDDMYQYNLKFTN